MPLLIHSPTHANIKIRLFFMIFLFFWILLLFPIVALLCPYCGHTVEFPTGALHGMLLQEQSQVFFSGLWTEHHWRFG